MSSPSQGPTGTELRLVLACAPVSLQAKRARKTALGAAITSALGSPEYLLSGEVSVSIEWMIHERLRYETLGSPDVDNILKVVLDALCGPTGILINDCQVQSVSCHWIDWTSQEQQVTITVRHSGDDWVRKKDLVFVRVLGHLCWPVHLGLPPKAIVTILAALDTMTKTNQELLRLSGDWYTAQGVMPVQRPFHSARLRGFTIMTVDELRAHVNGSADDVRAAEQQA